LNSTFRPIYRMIPDSVATGIETIDSRDRGG
jgi:hypothetical protein